MRVSRWTAVVSVSVVLAGVVPASASASGYAAGSGFHGSSHYHFSRVAVRRHGKRCTNTKVNAVNDSGAYAGEVYCGLARGFIRHGGTTKLVKGPRRSHSDTQLSAIASNGTVSLYTEHDYRPPYDSYLRKRNGTFKALHDPKAGRLGTRVLSVNAKGSAVGVYYPGSSLRSGRPFRYVKGRFRTFHLHVRGASQVALDTINDSGVVGGAYVNRHGLQQSFLLRRGRVHHIPQPHRHKTGFAISQLANNGRFVSVEFFSRAIISQVHRHGSYSRIRVPSSYGSSTAAFGINNAGEVVGYYQERDGRYRGFVARPRS